ncbi:MAG TPA: hypothetical protein VFU21_03320 [Kofleriaceae bacterium]|nr:hypothetical protein [Kofleriaceae bacterium]
MTGGFRASTVLAAALVAASGGCETESAAPAPTAAPSLAPQAAPPPAVSREQELAALAAEAKALEKAVKLARPGRDRLVAAQDAAAAWARWSELSGKPLPPSAVRVSRIAEREEAAAARREAREGRSFGPERSCCRQCTSGCPCGDTCIPCSRPCDKGPGCAC